MFLEEIYFYSRSDGSLYTTSYLKVRKICIHNLLLDAAIAAYSAKDLQMLLNLFSSIYINFGTNVSLKKTTFLS